MQEKSTYFVECQDEHNRMEQGFLEDDFYEAVAEQVRKMGFPQVNGATVDAVYQRQCSREKIMHPINQLIAWKLWWRLNHGEEELPA